MKIRSSQKGNVHLRQLIDDKIRKKDAFFSLEIVPAKETTNSNSLLLTIKEHSPLFYSLCCHNWNASVLETPECLGNNVLLHLIVNGLKRSDAEDFLNRALALDKTNIFVLRGDTVSRDNDFPYAADFISFIRKRFGSKFCICVAGYPEMHPSSTSKELDLYYLKAKVDAGADFIITQFFFKAQVFIDFVKDCRKVGITVPILPGLFPFTSLTSLERMVHLCHVNIPREILNDLELIKDSDERVMEYGINVTTKIIKDIFQSGTAIGYHLFTLNRLSVVKEIHHRLHHSFHSQQ